MRPTVLCLASITLLLCASVRPQNRGGSPPRERERSASSSRTRGAQPAETGEQRSGERQRQATDVEPPPNRQTFLLSEKADKELADLQQAIARINQELESAQSRNEELARQLKGIGLLLVLLVVGGIVSIALWGRRRKPPNTSEGLSLDASGTSDGALAPLVSALNRIADAVEKAPSGGVGAAALAAAALSATPAPPGPAPGAGGNINARAWSPSPAAASTAGNGFRLIEAFNAAQFGGDAAANAFYVNFGRYLEFGCSNADDRLRNPHLNPVFTTMPSGSCWAFASGEDWLAIPKLGLRIDEYNFNAAALNTVFECSGYDLRRTASCLRLIKPAFVRKSGDRWEVRKPGHVELIYGASA